MVYSNALKYNGRRFRFLPKKKRKIYVIKKKMSTIAMGGLREANLPRILHLRCRPKW